MKPLAAKIGSKLLNSGLLKRVITDDETWVYAYDVERILDRQDRQVRSNVKVMLIVFFDFNGIVNHGFLPRRSMLSAAYKFNVVCVK